MHLEMMRKDPVEHTTVITDCYIDLIHNSADPGGRAA
jgi:hypothetical protein